VCGLLLLPFLRLPAGALALAGAGAIALTSVLPLGLLWPTEEFLRAHAARATHVYAEGGFAEVTAFRWREAGQLIAPLLVTALPRTFGLMLLGVAAWRSGVVREPGRHRRLLGAIALVGGAVGGTATGLLVLAASSGRPVALPSELLEPCSSVPLALAYAAGLFLWLTPSRAAPFAPAGQMALTNYLAQSLVLGFVFYGYGLGLFGRLGPAPALLIGLALYAAQLAFSRAWLRRYRFGPAEWLWRSLTYGRRQPMRRVDEPAAA
jgi:uncharacterized protein